MILLLLCYLTYYHETFKLYRKNRRFCFSLAAVFELYTERAQAVIKDGKRRGKKYSIFEQSSFSKLSVTSPTSQLILQPFRRFTYVTAHYPTLPLLHLHHSSFSKPSFAFPTSQALHLRHLASRPWWNPFQKNF